AAGELPRVVRGEFGEADVPERVVDAAGAGGRSRSCRPNSTLRRTDNQGNGLRVYSWNTTASDFCTPLTAAPASLMEPAVGRSSPDRQRSSVVFPQPEGPTSTRNSPCAAVNVRSAIASVEPPREPR